MRRKLLLLIFTLGTVSFMAFIKADRDIITLPDEEFSQLLETTVEKAGGQNRRSIQNPLLDTRRFQINAPTKLYAVWRDWTLSL